MSDEPPIRRPAVARPARRMPAAAAAATLALTGLGIILWLSDARAAQADRETALPGLATTAVTTPSPFPSPPAAAAATIPPVATAPYYPAPAAAYYPPIRPAGPIVATDGADRARERLRAPTLIVDLAQTDPPRAAPAPGIATDAPGPIPPDPAKTLSDTERFSARVGGEEVAVAEAERMTGLGRMVPQGAIIGAVMETALNSDLPGFARAIVQRDVLSFDGSAILIPSGSRVIGQYKSGVAQGASRVFIVWTRLIRPDGVSIALASPAVDELGRGGVAGKVDRHFLQRFGGAILLSVLTGGINAAPASASRGSTVVVGTAGEASTLANQASRDLDIPPTITTPQGALVRIFVARDLDFTRVGPAR